MKPRVLGGFLDLWQPRSLIVDTGTTAPASGSFPAVVASDWTGVPGDATDGTDGTDGTIRNAAVLAANIDYVATVTA